MLSSDIAPRRPVPAAHADAFGVRPDRRHAHRRADRARRGHRLVLPAALRQRQRLRRHSGPGARRHLGHPASRTSGPRPSAISRAPTSSRPPSGRTDGVVALTDFMPVGEDGRPSGHPPEIHRQVRCTRGRVPHAGGLHAPLRVRGAHHPAGAAADRPLRHRPHRPGAHALERQAGGVDGRAVDRLRPLRGGEGRGSAGWSSATTTTTSIRPTATRAHSSSTSPPPSGRAGRRACATAGRSAAWSSARRWRSSC